MRSTIRVATAACLMAALPALAQQAEAPRPEYGPDINIETAKKIGAATIKECAANKWNVAVAIVNTHGSLVYYERMDNTQSASAEIAVNKAMTAAMYRRPTSAFVEALKSGPGPMTFPNVIAALGGLPIFSGGKIVGGIGVSGVLGSQDEQCAKAGLAAM